MPVPMSLALRVELEAPGDKCPPQNAVGLEKRKPLLKERAGFCVNRITVKMATWSARTIAASMLEDFGSICVITTVARLMVTASKAIRSNCGGCGHSCGWRPLPKQIKDCKIGRHASRTITSERALGVRLLCGHARCFLQGLRVILVPGTAQGCAHQTRDGPAYTVTLG